MLYSVKNVPPWPRVIGVRVKPTLRKSLGILRNYVGNGRRVAHRKPVRAPMGGRRRPRRKMMGGKLTVGKVLHGVNKFLKQSKVISTIAPAIVKNYIPKNYKGIPTQQIASQLVGLAKRKGYGRRRRRGGARGAINLRKTKNTFRDIGKFLHKTRVLSKIAQPLSTLVPPEYKQYSDAGLKILSNLGAGKRRRRRHRTRAHVGGTSLRQRIGAGKRLGLYGNMANVNTGRAYLGAYGQLKGGCMMGGNAPLNRFTYSSM